MSRIFLTLRKDLDTNTFLIMLLRISKHKVKEREIFTIMKRKKAVAFSISIYFFQAISYIYSMQPKKCRGVMARRLAVEENPPY